MTNNSQILVLLPEAGNRVRYIMEFLLSEQLGVGLKWTVDEVDFSTYQGIKFSYGVVAENSELAFSSCGLLFEKGVHEHNPKPFKWNDTLALFPTDNGPFPFDIFAAAFFLISRYEEYLPFKKDEHGRFPAKESLLFKQGFLASPVVNTYVKHLEQLLLDSFPNLVVSKKQFKYIPTYDVDSAYAYLSKGLIRNLGGAAKSALDFDLSKMAERAKVLLHLRNDPYDNFMWLEELHAQNHLRAIYFFLVGDYDEYDKNVSINLSEYQTLIRSLADRAKVGIHPSYASNRSPAKLDLEIERLSAVIKRDVLKSRQHFLKLQFPGTYNALIDHDIFCDHTMGFASNSGFRAGTCSSFNWYDLDEEIKTDLRIFPFCFMDATYVYYQKQPLHYVEEKLEELHSTIKAHNGVMITLFHNNTFADDTAGLAWRDMYSRFLTKVAPSYEN